MIYYLLFPTLNDLNDQLKIARQQSVLVQWQKGFLAKQKKNTDNNFY